MCLCNPCPLIIFQFILFHPKFNRDPIQSPDLRYLKTMRIWKPENLNKFNPKTHKGSTKPSRPLTGNRNLNQENQY